MNNTDISSGSDTIKIHSVSPRRELSPKEFRKKVRTLMKQIYELVTLCSVPGCLIIRSPDGKNTYTWPESRDGVLKFAETYFSKLSAGKSSNNGFGSGELCERRMNLNEERGRLMKALDEKIESLKKRIESHEKKACEGKRDNIGGEEDQILKVSKMGLENERSTDLSAEEDTLEKLVREYERLYETFKEIKGKRKYVAWIDAQVDDGKLKKAKELNIPLVEKLLQELGSTIKGDKMDMNNNNDDGTNLPLLQEFGSTIKGDKMDMNHKHDETKLPLLQELGSTIKGDRMNVNHNDDDGATLPLLQELGSTIKGDSMDMIHNDGDGITLTLLQELGSTVKGDVMDMNHNDDDDDDRITLTLGR